MRISRMPFSWFDIKDSLWYRPAVMTVVAILLSFVTIWLDHTLFREQRIDAWWLFEGGSEGARGVLTAIASTTMTVATTAFSFTLVALQLSSSQYSPRIVRNFTGDRTNQLVIGVFVATFVYTLLVLRVVRSEYGDRERFVPAISVTVSLLLAMICIASLIFFFHHATRTIQVSVIITRTAEQARKTVERKRELLDSDGWRMLDAPLPSPADLLPVDIARASQSGYVQRIDHDYLFDVTTTHNARVQVQVRAGDFVLADDPLVAVWAYPDTGDADPEPDGHEENGASIDEIRDVVTVGVERTLEADVLFGVQQVSDIALRALSPGINDPNTAISSVDRLAELLVVLRPVSGAEAVRVDDDDVVRITLPQASWDEMVQAAFRQIRHYASGDLGTSIAVIRAMGRVRLRVPPRCYPSLMEIARDMAEAALDNHTIERDRQLIRDALAEVERDDTTSPGHH